MKDARPSEKYSLLIGRIAAYWSVTELMCDQALAELLGIELNAARSITAPGMRFDARLDTLKSVARETLKDAEVRRELEAVLERLAAASEARDKVVHSVWFNLGYEDVVATKYYFEPGKTPITGSTKFKPEKLQHTLDQITDATEELTAFLLNRLGMAAATPGVVIHTAD